MGQMREIHQGLNFHNLWHLAKNNDITLGNCRDLVEIYDTYLDFLHSPPDKLNKKECMLWSMNHNTVDAYFFPN